MERACAASTTFAGAADLIVAAQRRADGALGRPVGQRAGPEERGSAPPRFGVVPAPVEDSQAPVH